jgi:hypothetical protein
VRGLSSSATRRRRASPDGIKVQPTLPPLPIAGLPEPLKVHMDWDAETVDAMMARLAALRKQMLGN